MLDRASGPLLVAIAALLWGTDSLFRFKAVTSFDPTFIVFFEHVVGVAILLPWMWTRQRSQFFRLGAKGWLQALIVGAGGGAIATVLFTASFRYLNPSVTVLLQKLQPIFVVLLAFAFLGERPSKKFYPWAAVALAAGFVLSFPDLDLSFVRDTGSVHAKGVFYALGASVIWGITTVAGRALLQRTTPALATLWRYGFGLATLCLIMAGAGISADPRPVFESREALISLSYLSIVTGLIPLCVYYAGMKRTPASVVTFVELLYPVSAVIINTLFLGTPLNATQMGAGGALLFAVTMISLKR